MVSAVMRYVEQADKVSPSIMGSLKSAVREWVLIFLLFVEACFSFLVTRFARYYHLQTPCLLCSRLDHVLGKERSEFYWDLICHKHKLQVSSSVLCHHHSNLVDVHGMCDSCLLSFVTVNKSNSETYRLLIGKLGARPHIGLDRDSKRCSCCNEQCVPRDYDPQLFQTKSIEFQTKGLDLHRPLSVNTGVDVEHEMSRDETHRADKVSPSSISNFDPLPHVEYEKVKLTSDSESETTASEDDAATSLLEEYKKKDFVFQSMQPGHGVSTSIEDPVLEKFIHPAPETERSHLESEVKFEVTNTKSNSETVALINHEPKGLHSIVEHRNDGSIMPELISLADMNPASPRDIEDAVDVQKETLELREEAEVETEEVEESSESGKTASLSIHIPTSNEQTHPEPDIDGRSFQMPDSFELGDAYRLAVSSRGRVGRQSSSKLFEQRTLSGKLLEQRSLSGKFLEQMSFKESSKGSEDFRLLLSQLSLARGIDPSLTDMSPRVPGNLVELTASDASTSVGIQVLRKRISLERNESNISLDGSTVSEIEGETAVDQLKRQIEHDKKLMCALYKELEEERNASAIAANQAMAMITRLQEEKATLHMEALQCLRMMDEQVEYDEEGLENAMELLTEKEKVVQDLEVKLQLYIEKYGPLSIPEDTVESFTTPNSEELGAKNMDADHVESMQSSTSVFSNPESNQQDTLDRVDESC